MKKHIIWGNMDLGTLEDWADFIQFQEEENGIVFEDEDEKWEAIYEMNAQYLEDERMNLGGLEKKFDGKIIAIANLGLWNGRHNHKPKAGVFGAKES